MPTPHVHAELIKAWADGAEIEYFSIPNKKWTKTVNPLWETDGEYRIKQQPKPKVTRWLWAFKFSSQTQWHVSSVYLTETEFSNWTTAKGIKLEWSAMEFDE